MKVDTLYLEMFVGLFLMMIHLTIPVLNHFCGIRDLLYDFTANRFGITCIGGMSVIEDELGNVNVLVLVCIRIHHFVMTQYRRVQSLLKKEKEKRNY
jgi:hypothetical protein